MQPPTYDLLYDAARASSAAGPAAAAGVAAALVGAAVSRYAVPRAPNARLALAARVAGAALAVFGVAGAAVVGGGVYAEHARLRAALRDGGHLVVEGTVYDRPPGGAAESLGASWAISTPNDSAARWYRYDASPLAAGYRRARPGDGGLRTGDRVRVADVRGRIARVEVAREGR